MRFHVNRETKPLSTLRPQSTFYCAILRPQRKYLQLFFPDETTADSVLKQGPYSIHGRTLALFPPKGKVPPRLIIKLGNVPIQNKEIVKKAIKDAMAPHMAIIEAVPYTIKNTHFMTSCWDVVVEPTPENPNLKDVPVLYQVLGETVVASWPGSPPSCINCLEAHGTKECPKRKPTLPTPNLSYADAAGGQKQKKDPKPRPPPQQSSSKQGLKGKTPVKTDDPKTTPPPSSSKSSDDKDGWKTVSYKKQRRNSDSDIRKDVEYTGPYGLSFSIHAPVTRP